MTEAERVLGAENQVRSAILSGGRPLARVYARRLTWPARRCPSSTPRARVREVLARLAHEQVVEVIPLADLDGNTALARQMRELSSLTCLIIFLYDAPTSTSCRADAHDQIIEAVAHRDLAQAQAQALML